MAPAPRALFRLTLALCCFGFIFAPFPNHLNEALRSADLPYSGYSDTLFPNEAFTYNSEDALSKLSSGHQSSEYFGGMSSNQNIHGTGSSDQHHHHPTNDNYPVGPYPGVTESWLMPNPNPYLQFDPSVGYIPSNLDYTHQYNTHQYNTHQYGTPQYGVNTNLNSVGYHGVPAAVGYTPDNFSNYNHGTGSAYHHDQYPSPGGPLYGVSEPLLTPTPNPDLPFDLSVGHTPNIFDYTHESGVNTYANSNQKNEPVPKKKVLNLEQAHDSQLSEGTSNWKASPLQSVAQETFKLLKESPYEETCVEFTGKLLRTEKGPEREEYVKAFDEMTYATSMDYARRLSNRPWLEVGGSPINLIPIAQCSTVAVRLKYHTGRGTIQLTQGPYASLAYAIEFFYKLVSERGLNERFGILQHDSNTPLVWFKAMVFGNDDELLPMIGSVDFTRLSKLFNKFKLEKPLESMEEAMHRGYATPEILIEWFTDAQVYTARIMTQKKKRGKVDYRFNALPLLGYWYTIDAKTEEGRNIDRSKLDFWEELQASYFQRQRK